MAFPRSLKLSNTTHRRSSRRSFFTACYLAALLGASYYALDALLSRRHDSSTLVQPNIQANFDAPVVPTRRRRPRPAPEQMPLSGMKITKMPQHKWRKDGLLGVNLEGRHPIFDLIEKAEEEWERKLNTASKSLDEAVAEYRRRYGRSPPKGFDQWYGLR
jgi:hypothetical protein